jgi:hypothetical protein
MVMENTSRLTGDVASYKSPAKDNTGASVSPGPYVAIVKNNIDPARMGRLEVLIPSLVGKGLGGAQTQLITCEYLSPFYGAKTTRYIDKSNPASYKASQHSYGMWMVPPDIDTKVLVIFAEGDTSQAYWIGCVVEPFLNQMTPGIGALDQTMTEPEGSEGSYAGTGKQSIYGTDVLPAGELNRAYVEATGESAKDGRKRYPIHPSAETLRQQGLVGDPVRGTTTSSARRESPSAVFGISTPGRRDTSSSPKNMGATDSVKNEIVDRLTGHTFVMDDGDADGDNQLIRLRSASGHQILLNDSAGVVYIANGTGNAWMEFSSNGSIDIYAGGSVSMRSAGDFNFHSDGNINMFAKNEIKMSAVSKMVLDALLIQQHADYDIQLQATGGSITTKSPKGNILSYAGQQQIHMASGQQHLTGSQVHFNSIGTNPNIVSTFERTSVLDPSGTGTKRELIPDVITSEKYRAGPLDITQNANVSMSGMRVPTHEPYPYHFDQVFSFVGFSPSANDKIPGTPEFIAQRNRLAGGVRAQMQLAADLQHQLEVDGYGKIQTAINKGTAGKITDAVNKTLGTTGKGTISAIQKAADDIVKNYNVKYGLPQNTLNAITPLTSGVSEIVNQTIYGITGTSKTGSLVKDAILVNKSGQLYTAGNFNSPLGKNVGTVKEVLTAISKSEGLSNQAGVYSTIGRIGIGVAEGAYQVIKDPKGAAIKYATSVVTDSFKNMQGGQVTAGTAISTVLNNIGAGIKTAVGSVTTAIGNIFKW